MLLSTSEPERLDDVEVAELGDPLRGLLDVGQPRVGEHREQPEPIALVRAEEVVAPGDRVAERLLALRQVARAAAEDVERGPRGAPAARPRRTAGPGPRPARWPGAGRRGGGQMAVMASALSSREPEAGLHGRGAIAEQPHRLRVAGGLGSSSRSGSESGGTGNTCSPRTRSASRLVTSTLRSGQCSRSSTIPTAAGVTCSKLSSTSRSCRSRSCASSASSGRASLVAATPTARATAAKASSTSRSALRSTKNTPSANCGTSSAAARIASRVLPVPPGPVRVMSRTSSAARRSREVAELGLPSEERRGLGRQVVTQRRLGPEAAPDRRRTAPSGGGRGRPGAGRAARRRRGTACTTRCPRSAAGRASPPSRGSMSGAGRLTYMRRGMSVERTSSSSSPEIVHVGRDPPVALPVDADEHVGLGQVRAVERPRRVGSRAELEHHRREPELLHRRTRPPAFVGELAERRRDEDAQPLIGSPDGPHPPRPSVGPHVTQPPVPSAVDGAGDPFGHQRRLLLAVDLDGEAAGDLDHGALELDVRR